MKLKEIGDIVEDILDAKVKHVDFGLNYFDYVNRYGEESRISSMEIIEKINNIAKIKGETIYIIVNFNGNIIIKSDIEKSTNEMGEINPISSSLFDGYLAMYKRIYSTKK